MERIGEITAMDGNVAEVTFCREKDCGECHACDGGQKRTVLHLPLNGMTASVGDLACVELPTGTVVKASLLAYALPIAGLLGGMGLGALLAPGNQAITALCGFVGLALTAGIVFMGEKRRRHSAAWQPVLIRVLPGAGYGKKTDSAGAEE